MTREGEIVWEYRTPHRDEEGRPAALRIQRLPPSILERIPTEPPPPNAARQPPAALPAGTSSERPNERPAHEDATRIAPTG